MSRSTHIALCTVLATVCVHAQEAELLTVRNISAATIRVEFEPAFVTYNVHAGDGRSFSYSTFSGAVLPQGAPGSPMIPYRAVPLELNGPSVMVRILETEESRTDSSQPAFYPRYEIDRAFGASALFETPAGSGGQIHTLPLAEITDVARAGGGYKGVLRIRPVRLSSSGPPTVTRRMVLLVESGPGSVQTSRANTLEEKRASANPLGSGEWYKMAVQESGIYKLDQAFFARSNIALSAIGNIQSIRIFGNGGGMIPENPSDPHPDGLEEMTRYVSDQNNNGLFDSGDYVLFFGRSPSGWTYNPSARSFSHWIHHYTTTNAYFLTFGGSSGRPMDSLASLNVPSPHEPADFQEMLFVEEERNNLLNSGRQWYGQLFDAETKIGLYSNFLPGYVSTKAVQYRVALLARSSQTGSFSVQENGDPLGGPVFTLGLDVTSIENDYAYQAPVAAFTRTLPIPGDRSVVRFSFDNPNPAARGWLNWMEIFYRRRFEAVNDFLAFHSPDTNSVVRYRLSGYSSREVEAFDCSDHANVRRIAGLTFDPLDPGKNSFELPDSAGSVRRYCVVGPNGYKTPGVLTRVNNTDLHAITSGAEYVIVTPGDFRSEAERLASHRQQRDGFSVLVASIEDIQNEFGAGLPDPLALRDFLMTAASWNQKPRYVLLFGNGHYDYKNIRFVNRNWIPPYESLESIHQIQSYASDDAFAQLTPGDVRVSVALGRIPVTNLAEARSMVDKIISYETSSSFDLWRNRVLFIADDGRTSTRDEGNIHTNQAEVLAQIYTPASVDKKKIYIIEFPTVNSSAGRRKPSANASIIDAMNRGSLIVNYTGHGNPQLWAHEAIFTRETSIPQLTNADKLFLLVAATCDFARYDNPAEQSAGEQILTMASGGAIGVVTASRAVYSFENSQFNNSLYTKLFARDSLGRAPRLGDAMFQTKQIHFSTNDLKYHLLGDPAMRLNLPPAAVGVDSVNGSPPAGVVAIQALSRASVDGGINRPDGSRWTGFDGQAILEVFDSKRTVAVPEWGGYTFQVTGSLLYRGLVSVTGGVFHATVPIPKDVSYNNDRARISVYAWSGTADAIGFTDGVTIAGTDSSAAIDTTGPRVEVFFEDESFRPGDVVPPNPLLLVKLFDASGINTSTASVGHRLEAVLSRVSQPLDLTDAYRGDIDTYQSGAIRYSLNNLPEGPQSIMVKAWDVYNNSSQTEITFRVVAAADVAMYQVFNFPNPVVHSTVFTFQRSSDEPIDIKVRIYTVAGRLIGEVESYSVVDRFVRIPWDARDQNGDALANGVYFYKIISSSADRTTSQEVVGKMTMLR